MGESPQKKKKKKRRGHSPSCLLFQLLPHTSGDVASSPAHLTWQALRVDATLYCKNALLQPLGRWAWKSDLKRHTKRRRSTHMNTHRAHRLVVAWWFLFVFLFVLIARIISTSSASAGFMPTHYKHWLHCVILHFSFFSHSLFALSCMSTTCQQQLINRPFFPSAACLLLFPNAPLHTTTKHLKKKSLKFRSVRTPPFCRFVASTVVCASASGARAERGMGFKSPFNRSRCFETPDMFILVSPLSAQWVSQSINRIGKQHL